MVFYVWIDFSPPQVVHFRKLRGEGDEKKGGKQNNLGSAACADGYQLPRLSFGQKHESQACRVPGIPNTD